MSANRCRVFPRSDADDPLEVTSQVTLIDKPASRCYRGRTTPPVEQLARSLDAAFQKIRVGRQAESAPERSNQMILAQTCLRRELAQRYRLIRGIGDQRSNAVQLPDGFRCHDSPAFGPCDVPNPADHPYHRFFVTRGLVIGEKSIHVRAHRGYHRRIGDRHTIEASL